MKLSRSESACLLLKERCGQDPGFREVLFYEMDIQHRAWSAFNAKAQQKIELQFYPVDMLNRPGTAFSQQDMMFIVALGNEFGWLAVAKAMHYLWQEEQEVKSFGEKLKSLFIK